MLLLAQAAAETIDGKTMLEWWSHYGPLGIAAFFVLGAVVFWFYRITVPHVIAKQAMEREHLLAKQKMEISREIKTEKLLDTMGEVIPKQLALAERLAVRQEAHAASCERTDRSIGTVEKHIGEVLQIVRELQTP